MNAEGSNRLDEPAIREFLKSDYPKLVAAVALMSGSRAVAEDAVQEALARAWERSERGEHIESPKAWVTTVAMNLARSAFRRILAERRAGDRLASGVSEAPSEDRVDIARALRELPRRQRQATVLRYFLGYDVAEVAAILGVKEGTAKTNLHRARQKLAEVLGVKENDVVGS